MTEFFLPDVTGENVMGAAHVAATLDGRRTSGTFDKGTVERSLRLSTEIARRSILGAEQLRFVEKSSDGSYTFAGDADLRHAKRSDLGPFFGKHLLRFPPFLIFVTELTREYPPEDAAAFTVGVLNIQCKPALALKVLKGWGLYCDLLKIEGGVLTPTFQPLRLLDFGFLKRLSEAMQSDAQVRTFVVDELGPELLADMSNRGAADLPIAIADALVKHESEPRRIGDPVGSMIEAYCAKLLTTPVESNSLPDLARKLEDQGVILTPHRLLLNGVAGVRHPASHGVDRVRSKEEQDMAPKTRGRSAITGRFVKHSTVKRHPQTTVQETRKAKKS